MNDRAAVRSINGSDSLLIVLPLPVFVVDGEIFLDGQAQNGIARWLDNFDSVTLALPEIPTAPPSDAQPFDPAAFGGRCGLVRLPNRWSPIGFAQALPSVSRLLSSLIDRAAYLHFAIGGLWGDWGAVAALIAHRKHRPCAVWTDRVESQVRRVEAGRASGPKKWYRHASALLMAELERQVIRRAELGLFHGADCYEAYARYSREPHLVHDIHLNERAAIGAEALAAKATRAEPLRVIYAGRVHPDKGPADWVAALRLLREAGCDFTATWLGDGPQLDAMRRLVDAEGLGDRVAFAGALQERETLLRLIREADIFLFCHQTPESPRCLIEALICGTPIIGYDSAYPRDLISANHGGALTDMNPSSLATALAALDRDRPRLAALQRAAALDGRAFTDVEVFRHRSDLMKAHLGGPAAARVRGESAAR